MQLPYVVLAIRMLQLSLIFNMSPSGIIIHKTNKYNDNLTVIKSKSGQLVFDESLDVLNINLNDIQNMKTILVIGSDMRKETPILAHWVKKAANNGSSIHFIDTYFVQ